MMVILRLGKRERERVAGAKVHIGIKHFFFTDLLKHISKSGLKIGIKHFFFTDLLKHVSKSGLKIRIKHFLHIFHIFQRKRFIVRFKCKIMYLYHISKQKTYLEYFLYLFFVDENNLTRNTFQS